VAAEESDERLMLRFQAGDAGAFESLVRRHRGPVFNFLVRLMGDRPRAEDLLQDAWLKVVDAAPRWERRARFTTWLYTIARNLALDERRKSVHRKSESLEAIGADGRSLADGLPGEGPAPDRGAEDALLRPRLEAALAALPEEQREVFLLREYAGLPFQEIGRVTGVSENTVKSRMRYSLEALRRQLEALGVGPDDAAAAAEPRSAIR
jgi:RNA polymerase sigma-70 factor (ECF subfamily)